MSSPLIPPGLPMQHLCDAAFARQIWWETFQLLLEKDVMHTNLDLADHMADAVSTTFIQRCESGFFDVKPRNASTN